MSQQKPGPHGPSSQSERNELLDELLFRLVRTTGLYREGEGMDAIAAHLVMMLVKQIVLEAEASDLIPAPSRDGKPELKIPPLRIPPWVPEPVRERVARNNDGELENPVSRRLLTDKRMRYVWAELSRHKRADYQQTQVFLHERNYTAKYSALPEGFVQNLSAFFFWSYCAAGFGIPTMTKEEAARIFWMGSPPTFIPVQRHTANDDVRSYVCVLEWACEALFNSPLYSTVATTASVALNKHVSAADVRRIVRRSPLRGLLGYPGLFESTL